MKPTSDSSPPVRSPDGENTAPPLPPLVVPPLIIEAHKAFERDLPQLLRDRLRQWVAYHGSKQIGFDRSKTRIYQECLRRGLPENEFVVRCIEPEAEVLTFSPEGDVDS